MSKHERHNDDNQVGEERVSLLELFTWEMTDLYRHGGTDHLDFVDVSLPVLDWSTAGHRRYGWRDFLSPGSIYRLEFLGESQKWNYQMRLYLLQCYEAGAGNDLDQWNAVFANARAEIKASVI